MLGLAAPEGARVVGMVEGGAWATRVAVPTRRLAALPDGVAFAAAAALGIAGLTALRVVRRGGPLLGRRVLITGAGGGVGHFVTQLAALAGARVSPDQPEEAAFDIMLEGIGGRALKTAVASLKPGGTIVLFGASDPEPVDLTLLDFVGHEGATIVTFFSYAAPDDDVADLVLLADLVGEGRLRPETTRSYPLKDAAAAVTALSARGVRGKIVLTPN